MMTRPTLDEIGIQCGTDKSSKGHNYLKYYDMFLSHLRNEMFVLLELGVWEGASLKMWSKYFPKAIIQGADIEDKSQYDTDTIGTVIINTLSAESIDNFITHNALKLKVIIDDAGHESEAQILAFDKLFPVLQPGGFYIIEDTLCAFDKSRWGKNANVFDRIHQMVDEVNVGGKIDSNWICANKEQQINVLQHLNYFELNIEWVFVGMGFVIVKKIG